ncbi:LysR family transcriptional regulator [Thalassovita sp.]|uniref:LysR family transcriptional regulator n=1 Tax=Thalassovita sp. TaxID=1979401 RepID=UPI0029DE8814|nr:LysR family transcriptional regulator [Thalassovita sp.]
MDVSRFVRNRLKIRHMYVLIALDDTLSVSRAAESLNVAQASVSRTLAEIEEGFGMQIFERHPRGLRRTKTGRELVLGVRKVVGSIHALESLAEQVQSLGHGQVTIGVHNVSLLGRVAAVMADFKANHPNITITLRDGLLPNLLEDLQYGRLDLVLGRLEPMLEQRGFGFETLAETVMLIGAREGVPPPPADPVELLKKPWAIPLPGTPMRENFDRFCASHDCPLPADRIETNNGFLMAEFLLQMDRYALFPAILREDSPLTLDLFNFSWLKCYEYPFNSRRDRQGIVYSKSNVMAPAVAAILHALQAGFE